MKTWLVEQQLLLSAQIEQVKLPHALLINGVPNSGKSELADWLVNVLLCQQPHKQAHGQDSLFMPCTRCKSCLLYHSKTFPDHLDIKNHGKTIGVDQVRQVSKFFEQKPQLGQCKSALLTDAHTMTVQAANALLKTLEEPNNNDFVVLLTSEIETLLPTIISRCFVLDLRPPVGNDLLKELGQHSGDPFVNLSHYSELTDVNLQESYHKFERCFLNFLQHDGSSRAELLALLVDNPESLRWLEKISAKLMRSQNGWLERIATQQNVSVWPLYQAILVIVKQIKTLHQANRTFVFEKLLVDLQLIISSQD